MNSENELIQKLMVSKKIMERHNNMPRGNNGTSIPNVNISPEVESFQQPVANYNIPQEMLMESKPQIQSPKVSTKDKILSSKLPDEIKRLMIEHPIVQPNQATNPVLSNDLVEKATRLMNVDASGKQVGQQQPKQFISQSSNIDTKSIKDIVRETIEEVLSENNLLIESETQSKDIFTFKVGKHIFEGKVTKIKKLK